MPTISILLPVYNAVFDLPRAIRSIQIQTFKDFEIIAIDDGSMDGSGELLDDLAKTDPRIRVFHQDNAGALGKVLNKAIEMAQGKYLARQDADDASNPHRLEAQVGYLQKHPKIGLCGTWSWYVDHQLGPLFSLELPDDHNRLKTYLEKGMNPFVHGSIMARAELFQKVGGYRGSYAEDYDLWLRLSEITGLGISTRLGYYFWRSVSGISFGAHAKQAALIKLYLMLHSERVTQGKENLDWEREYSRIVTQPTTETSDEERQSSMHYARGIQLLRRGLFGASREEFELAVQGEGQYAIKAKRNLSVFGLAPVLATIYHILESQEPFHFARTIPEGTQVPDFSISQENKIL
jgi:glycosyltransferase involved in cell wall biosynthesis